VELLGQRFLVTGGAGFVGSHVVDALLDAGAGEVMVFDLSPLADRGRVRTFQGDVRDVEAVRGAVERIDGVFHLAVLPFGPTIEEPRLGLEVNVVGTFNVLEAAVRAGVRKVVFSSASAVYGDTDETMDESHPLGARTLYGATKIAGEYLVRAFADRDGLEYVTLRYMNVYGPDQRGGLIPSVLGKIGRGEPPVIAGDGSQSFDFVHVADVAEANVRAMASDVSGVELNVGSGAEVSVREVVERLLELRGSDLEPVFDYEQRVLMRRRAGSSERARELLGWSASRDLDTGLREVVESLQPA
jgi:nucleoside-diphosphate-sugar epimerase